MFWAFCSCHSHHRFSWDQQFSVCMVYLDGEEHTCHTNVGFQPHDQPDKTFHHPYYLIIKNSKLILPNLQSYYATLSISFNAKSFPYHNLIVILPPEIWSQPLLVRRKPREERRQLRGGVEILDIDEGVRRRQVTHVGPGQHHGHHAVCQGVIELLRDIILAQTVLEREIKLVWWLQQVVTFVVRVPAMAIIMTGQVTALPVHVNTEKLLQRLCYQLPSRLVINNKVYAFCLTCH